MKSRFVKGLGQIFKQLFYLVGKVGLTLLLTMGFGLGWAFLLFWSQRLDHGAIKLAIVVGSGIGSGLLARLILQKHTFILRLLSAWFSQGVSLLYLNNVTMGIAGFNFFQSQPPGVNWEGLWQISLGALIAYGALSAWRKNTHPQPLYTQAIPPRTPGQFIEPVYQAAQPLRSKPARGTKKEEQNRPISARTRSTASGNSSAGVMAKQSAPGRGLKQVGLKNSLSNPLRLQRPLKSGQKSTDHPMAISRPRRSKSRRLPIRLVGKEEHRCPFCLTLVDPEDPAGVVICSACHSYHHKSCWDVTGTCQVPHLHSE